MPMPMMFPQPQQYPYYGNGSPSPLPPPQGGHDRLGYGVPYPPTSTSPVPGQPSQNLGPQVQEGEKEALGRARTTTAGGVIVHQDAGRVPQPAEEVEERQEEIPPTYESIPADERR